MSETNTTQGFREGPTYRAATSAEQWDAALKMEADRQAKNEMLLIGGCVLLALCCAFFVVRYFRSMRT